MNGSPSTHPLLVVTDLDGTLLDEATYSLEPAREALASLRERGVPLVLSSSKTRAEMEPLARELGLATPLVVENGGAVVVPSGHLPEPVAGARRQEGAWVVDLGRRRESLVRDLALLAAETASRVVGFASLPVEEVARVTGLSVPAARLACAREYDEPFLLDPPEAARSLEAAARRRGLTVTRGGRFFHLTGATDKGRALEALLALYASAGRRFTTLGLGDAANDLPMLRAVDRPVIVPRPDGSLDPVLAEALPGSERAAAPGPRGWNDAVSRVLRGERLAHAASRSAAR